jgi:hypothetical protein
MQYQSHFSSEGGEAVAVVPQSEYRTGSTASIARRPANIMFLFALRILFSFQQPR